MTDPAPRSRFKRVAFRLAAIALPFVAIGAIELGFRLFGGPPPDPHINVSPFSIFTRETIRGTACYRITHRYAYAERNRVFPIRKPARGLRIFCLGGSACASWPYRPPETFDAYLQHALAAAFPGRPVEVINAAAHGFAAYRVRRIFDRIVDLEPDAILIYSGNNEFVENREYRPVGGGVTAAVAKHSRFVQWLQSSFGTARTDLEGDELKDLARFFWKKVKREALELRRDPEKFARVKRHYAASIEYMVAEATRRDLPVILCTVPVNLADWLPTVSVNRLTGDELDAWRTLLGRGRRALLERDLASAVELLERAAAWEPEHAETRFWLGRAHASAGRRDAGREHYVAAKDLDYNPFRAHSDFNRAVREIVSRYEHAHVLDLERVFDAAAAPGIPGFDLFLDYVHPTRRGNLSIAEKAFDLIIRNRLLGAEPRLETFTRGLTTGRDGRPYDETRDLSLQRRKFNLYAMNHQYDAAVKQARLLHRLETGRPPPAPGEAFSDALPAKLREGHRAFERHLRLRRRQILGEAVDPAEAAAVAAELRAFYDKWYGYGTF